MTKVFLRNSAVQGFPSPFPEFDLVPKKFASFYPNDAIYGAICVIRGLSLCAELILTPIFLWFIGVPIPFTDRICKNVFDTLPNYVMLMTYYHENKNYIGELIMMITINRMRWVSLLQ